MPSGLDVPRWLFGMELAGWGCSCLEQAGLSPLCRVKGSDGNLPKRGVWWG